MSNTMTAAEANANRYTGRTGRIARPYLDGGVYLDAADLLAEQLAWDQAAAWDVESRRSQDARVAQVESARLAADEARQVAARADLERELERRFMTQPAATAADWEACRDILVREALLAAPDPVAEARAELLRSGRYARF